MELGTQSVHFMNVTAMNLNIQGMGFFKSSSGRLWQFCQKKRRIPLNSPIVQILNLTYDPLEVWCPVKGGEKQSDGWLRRSTRRGQVWGFIHLENSKAVLVT